MPQTVTAEEVARHYPPCLFDRLIGARTGAAAGGRPKPLHEAVQRDLGWLLGTSQVHDANALRGLAHVVSSVLNYGVPAVEQAALPADAIRKLEADVREAIVRFEPRIARDSLDVSCRPASTPDGRPCVELCIEGDLTAAFSPTRIALVADLFAAGGGFVLRSRDDA